MGDDKSVAISHADTLVQQMKKTQQESTNTAASKRTLADRRSDVDNADVLANINAWEQDVDDAVKDADTHKTQLDQYQSFASDGDGDGVVARVAAVETSTAKAMEHVVQIEFAHRRATEAQDHIDNANIDMGSSNAGTIAPGDTCCILFCNTDENDDGKGDRDCCCDDNDTGTGNETCCDGKGDGGDFCKRRRRGRRQSENADIDDGLCCCYKDGDVGTPVMLENADIDGDGKGDRGCCCDDNVTGTGNCTCCDGKGDGGDCFKRPRRGRRRSQVSRDSKDWKSGKTCRVIFCNTDENDDGKGNRDCCCDDNDTGTGNETCCDGKGDGGDCCKRRRRGRRRSQDTRRCRKTTWTGTLLGAATACAVAAFLASGVVQETRT
jgi:hypothetical protein